MSRAALKEYTALGVILLAVFFIYISTTFPAFKSDDSPETAYTALTLGIGHPPGYPLYTLAGRIFTLIPLASPAFRMNVFSSFLSLLVLLTAYFLIKHINLRIFGKSYMVIGYMAIWILAFSYIFWNQAIEAKGGIYILNLFFFAVIIMLSVILMEKFETRYLYLLLFVCGLGLANHWPSIILLGPFVLYVLYAGRRSIDINRAVFAVLFLCIGASPYIYLPIRASSMPVLNWGNPADTAGFWWVVLRKGYMSSTPLFYFSLNQLTNFTGIFHVNYGFLWLLFFPGIYILYRKERKTALYMLFILIFSSLSVIFYNPQQYSTTSTGAMWLMAVFLTTPLYLTGIFIGLGAGYLFLKAARGRAPVAVALAVIFCVILVYTGTANYRKNNSSRDYTAYDYGKNLIKSMDENSVFFAEGDYDTVPLVYLLGTGENAGKPRMFPVTFLLFNWGIAEFNRRFGYVSMNEGNILASASNILEKFYGKVPLYRSSVSPLFDALRKKYVQKQEGMAAVFGGAPVKSYIFELYSYRGIYEKHALRDHNIDMLAKYPVNMYNTALNLLSDGRRYYAVKILRRAAAFRGIKPEKRISLLYEKVTGGGVK